MLSRRLFPAMFIPTVAFLAGAEAARGGPSSQSRIERPALVFLIAGQSNAGGVAAFSPETNEKSGMAAKHPTIAGSTAKEVGIPTTRDAYPRTHIWKPGKPGRFERLAPGENLLGGYGDVDGDGKIEVIYDHEGCDAAEGPIYVVEPLTGRIKSSIDYRTQGVRHAQNIALGDFDKMHKGLEIAFCEKGSNIYLFDAAGKLLWKRPVPASLLSKGDWDGDGDDEVFAFGLGANVDGIFSVWDGDGTRLYAISFLPSPHNRFPDDTRDPQYKKNFGGTWRAHAMPGGHEGIRRQVDLDGNGKADVIMPFGEWHWGSDAILFLMECGAGR